MRIFIFVLSFIIGTILIKYSFQIGKIFGYMTWAEKYLGTASTYTVWKLIGILVIALGVMYGFGVIF